MAMLAAAGTLPWMDDEAPVGAASGSLLEALMASFAMRLEAALSRGVDRSYAEFTVDAAALRGRLRVRDQIRVHRGLNHRLIQDRDLLETDTQLNRVLRATCALLLRCTDQPDTRRRLTGTSLLLDQALDVAPGELLQRWPQLHRRNEHFAGVLEFCHMVLRGLTPGRSSGPAAPFSVLFPMDRVFEAFVGRQLRAALAPLGHQVHLQDQGFLARDESGQARLKLRPDIVVKHEHEVVAVLDTKWKQPWDAAGKLRPTASDVQQMLSYGHRWNCPRTILVYPFRGKHPGARWESMREPQAWRLELAFLDMADDGATSADDLNPIQDLVIAGTSTGVQSPT